MYDDEYGFLRDVKSGKFLQFYTNSYGEGATYFRTEAKGATKVSRFEYEWYLSELLDHHNADWYEVCFVPEE